MTEWIGRTVSKVEIQKLLGRGGMAEVYLGRHTTLNRPVAVKVLMSHLSEDDNLLNRFTAEAQAVAALRHPNIVQVFDFDVIDDRPYIVMELLDGPSLKDYLRDLRKAGGRLPERTIARLIASLASALDYAHARRIVHRDIKPANVILRAESGPIDSSKPLSSDVEPVLTDFGVARIADTGTQTASGVIIGTPAYMSPEQASGRPTDHRSDIYSLGVMLYEMLSGKLPFEGDSQASILIKHITEPPPPLPTAIASPEVQAVIERALAKNPDDRYQKAGDLAMVLYASLGLDDETGITEPSMMVNLEAAKPADADATYPLGIGQAAKTGSAAEAAVGEGPSIRRGFNPIWAIGGVGVLGVIIGVIALATSLGRTPPIATESGEVAPAIEQQVISTDTPAAPTTELTQAAEVTTVAEGPPPSPTIDLATPRGQAVFRDATLTITLADLQPPPEGSVYEAWLIGPDVQPLSLGAVELANGRMSLIYADPAGQNLLNTYNGFVISIEPTNDVDRAPSGVEAYKGQIPEDIFQRLRLLFSVRRRETLKTALLNGMPFQARQYTEHLNLAIQGINSGSLPNGKTHSEHVINIVVGINSPDYADWDGNGRLENPGDNMGLANYLLIAGEAVQGAAHDPSVKEDVTIQQSVSETRTLIDDILLITEDARQYAVRVASADSVEEARELARAMDALRIESAVALLAQRLDALNLAITVDVFAVP